MSLYIHNYHKIKNKNGQLEILWAELNLASATIVLVRAEFRSQKPEFGLTYDPALLTRDAKTPPESCRVS